MKEKIDKSTPEPAEEPVSADVVISTVYTSALLLAGISCVGAGVLEPATCWVPDTQLQRLLGLSHQPPRLPVRYAERLCWVWRTVEEATVADYDVTRAVATGANRGVGGIAEARAALACHVAPTVCLCVLLIAAAGLIRGRFWLELLLRCINVIFVYTPSRLRPTPSTNHVGRGGGALVDTEAETDFFATSAVVSSSSRPDPSRAFAAGVADSLAAMPSDHERELAKASIQVILYRVRYRFGEQETHLLGPPGGGGGGGDGGSSPAPPQHLSIFPQPPTTSSDGGCRDVLNHHESAPRSPNSTQSDLEAEYTLD